MLTFASVKFFLTDIYWTLPNVAQHGLGWLFVTQLITFEISKSILTTSRYIRTRRFRFQYVLLKAKIPDMNLYCEMSWSHRFLFYQRIIFEIQRPLNLTTNVQGWIELVYIGSQTWKFVSLYKLCLLRNEKKIIIVVL